MPTSVIASQQAGAFQSRGLANHELPGDRNHFGEMDSSQFMRVLMTELTNQDPLDPHDSQQILEQISSIRNIESQMKLQDRLEEMVLQNELSHASNLIGRMVEGLDAQNDRVEGLVTSIRIRDGQAYLELDTGKELSLDRLEKIRSLGTDEGGEDLLDELPLA